MTEIFVRTALVGDIFFCISENKVGVDTGNPYLDDDLSDTSGSAADGNATYIEQ